MVIGGQLGAPLAFFAVDLKWTHPHVYATTWHHFLTKTKKKLRFFRIFNHDVSGRFCGPPGGNVSVLQKSSKNADPHKYACPKKSDF